MKTNLKKPLTLMGFDYGTKSIGIALGQTVTNTAQELTAVRATDGKPDWAAITKLIQEWQPQILVVGLPLSMDGTAQSLTEKAKYFSQELQQRFQLLVYQEDERLTSVEARSVLFEKGGFRSLKKQAIDSLSARFILESWMSRNLKSEEE